MAKPIPDGAHTVTPQLSIKEAAKAIDFYVKALGAKEVYRLAGPDGKIMHAAIQIGDSHVYLADSNPEMGCKGPTDLGGSPVSLHIYSEDVDASFDRAVKAGATVVMPVADMFWGDRYGRLKDPFGHEWSIATHKEDLSPEQIKAAGEKFMKEFAGAKK